jgi:hypothetical protein
MSKVMPGRYTAQMNGSFVVFIIGMRINKLLSINKWLPVVNAMNPMLQELYRNKELGFLDASFHLSWRGVSLIQYWRSFEQLEDFSRTSDTHQSIWKKYNKHIGKSGVVGIYHETYLIDENKYECIYNNMPVFGLGKAGEHIPAQGKHETAKKRLGR